ncbi:MAG: hypothetical protein IKG40_03705 [Bacilli bacterium]|nr:hypothetical protein [Bacilli bacterium]
MVKKDVLFSRILEIKDYIENNINEKFSIEATIDFLEYAMNMEEFQLLYLENEYLNGITLSSQEKLAVFFNKMSNEEILDLYDSIYNVKEKDVFCIKKVIDKGGSVLKKIKRF